MGLSRIRAAAWALALCCGALAGTPAMAQSFGGMSMIDFEAERDSYFQSADHNGDLALSGDEQMDAMGLAQSELFEECTDSDGDGMCSYSEFLDSGQSLFDSLDANRDGKLSTSEVQSAQ